MLSIRFLPCWIALLMASAAGAEGLDGGGAPNRMEVMLVRSILDVANSNLDRALDEVDALLKINPNFRLAQLVKGDLLLARSRPLTGLGNAPDASQEQLADLRDEARVRLQRYQEQPSAAQEPKYLWQLNASQRYAIVVDTGKSTLYLYKNVNGAPQFVADFYVSSGKKGAAKVSEGDQKTPLGVYFVNEFLPRDKLTDFYGSGAYPLNYPNEWDVRNGRGGHGIWLHGTPSDTYSRPPRASSGCVVLANDDLQRIGSLLQVGLTPVIITSSMHWSDAQDRNARAELLKALEQWRQDWSSLDTEAYLRHYAQDFSSGGYGLADWAQQKRQVNANKAWIKVRLTDISMLAYPDENDLVVVDFEQDYTSSNLNNHMKKRQYWVKRGEHWQIIYEGAA